MHSKRFRKPDKQLYFYKEAVWSCFRHKWRRRDILQFIEEYGGVDRKKIIEETLKDGNACVHRDEASWNIAYTLSDIVDDLVLRDIEPEDMEPVIIRRRPDGMTGKMRDIAMLCILHQFLEHVAFQMIEPLIRAKLFPTQHASIPKRGQTKLKDQTHNFLLRESLGITNIQKTDVVHAYATLQYSVIVEILRKEIPKAKTAIRLVGYLGKLAPGGHLIIGGYLDAWLFNFAMSYAIEHLYSLTTKRRNKITPKVIRVETYMDDFAIMTASVKNMKIALKELKKYCNKNLGVDIRETTGIIKILPVEEEKRRKNLPKPSQRGVPMLDMAGYRISRSHVIIRRRVWKKTRRQLMRAWIEYKETGTLPKKRAQKLIAYNGYIKQTDSRKIQEKYHTAELMKMAKRISRHHSYLDRMRRKEQINDLQRYAVEYPAPKDKNRKPTGRS